MLLRVEARRGEARPHAAAVATREVSAPERRQLVFDISLDTIDYC